MLHASTRTPGATGLSTGVRVGFVVSKAVGDAVRRNRVLRRLRHLSADRISLTPAGTDVVVRALPAAATEPQRLPADLSSAWSSALTRLAERSIVRSVIT